MRTIESNRKYADVILQKAFNALNQKSDPVSVFGKYNLVLSGTFDMTILVLRRFNNLKTLGTHTGNDNASVLTHTVSGITADELIGMYVSNDTDGSFALITDNDATTITGTLVGGTGNDWDAGDAFSLWYVAATLTGADDPQYEEVEEGVDLMAVVSARNSGTARLRISQ